MIALRQIAFQGEQLQKLESGVRFLRSYKNHFSQDSDQPFDSDLDEKIMCYESEIDHRKMTFVKRITEYKNTKYELWLRHF